MKNYTVDELCKARRSGKIDNAKEWVRRKLRNAECWFYNNKELVMFLAPVVAGGTTTLVKVVSRNAKLRKEKLVKDLYCYDRSLGHYWRLRRELTNAEWVQIDKRKKNGERLADILNELKVLK